MVQLLERAIEDAEEAQLGRLLLASAPHHRQEQADRALT